MAATELTRAEELRYELVAKIARPRLLALQAEYDWASFLAACEADAVRDWRRWRMAEVDEALDEALDAADAAILAHA